MLILHPSMPTHKSLTPAAPIVRRPSCPVCGFARHDYPIPMWNGACPGENP